MSTDGIVRNGRKCFESTLATAAPGSATITAVGATNLEGYFVVYLDGVGFQYLSASGSASKCWTDAGAFKLGATAIAGRHGLHFRRVGGGGADGTTAEPEARCAFLEGSRSLVCVRLAAMPPGGGGSAGASPRRRAAASAGGGRAEAVLVARVALGDDAAAVAAVTQPADTDAPAPLAVATANGALRCYDASTGKAIGKPFRCELPVASDGGMALASLPGSRLALLSSSSVGAVAVDFCIVAYHAADQRLELLQTGHLQASSGGSPAAVPGALQGAVAQSSAGKESVLLCWGGTRFAVAVGLDSEAGGSLSLLPQMAKASGEKAKASNSSWFPVQGYFVELRNQGKASSATQSTLAVRDGRFGVQVAEGAADVSVSGAAPLLVATSPLGRRSILAAGGRLTALRWELPAFSLQLAIGSAMRLGAATTETVAGSEALGPLLEVAAGKRARDDPAVEELFSGKRRATTDRSVAVEVRARRLKPTQEIVDEVAKRGCKQAARALLALPELNEDLAVQLLVAQPELLPRVVRRAREPHLLAGALRDRLPAKQLKSILEVLQIWLESYREFPEAELRAAVPGLPRPVETIQFLSALADGCLPSLAREDPEDIGRILEGLLNLQRDFIRTEHLYGSVRAALRPRKPFQQDSGTAPVEVMLLAL
eukprot:TRINITY_DN39268_c0_g1_i1.p1 TRINITY_DN39268_c0_g1~~TRINITY_DN39268_c0_g1_i1.p1  ORF type:complete len:657 (-),score=146.76 TRINITY_DN39268_c0_g1_i1:54-2024(-)